MDKERDCMGLGKLKKKLKDINISDISFAEYDHKDTDRNLFAKLKNSLTRFGQLKPILLNEVDGKYNIIDGKRMVLAFKSLEIPVISAIVFTDLDESDEILLRIIFTQFNFDYDIIKLVDYMHGMMDKYSNADLAELLPYTEDKVENFRTLFDFDWGQYIQEKKVAEEDLIKTKKLF